MSQIGAGNSPSIGLDQLIALNEEMAALVRAGVPLESSLIELGRDLMGTEGKIAEQLGLRLQSGESLAQIIEDEDSSLPELWRKVVAAGLRSGDLAAALKGMAATGQRVAEIHRLQHLAMIYPTILVVVAYCMMLLAGNHLLPAIEQTYLRSFIEQPPTTAILLRIGQWLTGSAIWLTPVLTMVLVIFWYWLTRPRAMEATLSAGERRRFVRSPWPARRSLQDGRLATMVELLAMMLQHRVPLPDAIVLAADASGDKSLAAGARVIAERLTRGESAGSAPQQPSAFPPLLSWLLCSGTHAPLLPHTLRETAAGYRRRAARSAAITSLGLPILTAALFGGLIVISQAAVVFGPIWRLMHDLGKAI